MTGVPIEFERVFDRISLLKKGIVDQSDINIDYELLLDQFRLIAANPTYAKVAELFIVKYKSLLQEILNATSSILKNYKHCSDFKDVGQGYEERFDDSGIPYEVPIISLEETVIAVSDEFRKAIYIKQIYPELQAYRILIEEYGQYKIPFKKIIDERVAWMIASIEVGEEGRFIKKGESTKYFVSLLSDPFLTGVEINKMKIEISLSVKAAAYIINELFQNNIIELSVKSLGNLGILFNGETRLTYDNLKSELSKFKGLLISGKSSAPDIQKDVFKVIDKISQPSK